MSGFHKPPSPQKNLTEFVFSDVGDWFVLRQISKNVDPYFFEQLIGDLTENIPVDTMPASNGRQTGRIYPTPNSRKIEVSFMKDKHGV